MINNYKYTEYSAMKGHGQKWHLVYNICNGTVCYITLSVIHCSEVFHLYQAIVSQNSKENYCSVIVKKKQNVTTIFLQRNL